MIRQFLLLLINAAKIAGKVAFVAGPLGWALAWYQGSAMLNDWAWLEAQYILGISLTANVVGLLWWVWEKTPKLVITGLSSHSFNGGALRRITIDVKNFSLSTDEFSVHVRAEQNGEKIYFGTLSRYSVKTEAREADYVQNGREDSHRFKLSGGETKSLCIFAIDSTLTKFLAPSYIMTAMVPFDNWKIFVSVEASSHSREYEVVHRKAGETMRVYLRSYWMDRFGFDMEATAPPKILGTGKRKLSLND